MRFSCLCCLLSAFVSLSLLAGCGGEAAKSSSSKPKKVVADVKGLPALASYIPNLDDGRVEIAPPKGWSVPSRSSEHLIRFKSSDKSEYPSIIVTVDDFEDVLDVTKENAAEFTKALAAVFAEEESTAKVAKVMLPIEIGSFGGATYRRKGSARYGLKKISLDRLFVDTVVGGRRYSFELRTRTGSVDEFKAALYAVARGLKSVQAEEEPEAPAETPEAKPEAEPEEEPEAKVEEEAETKPETKPEPKKDPESKFELLEED